MLITGIVSSTKMCRANEASEGVYSFLSLTIHTEVSVLLIDIEPAKMLHREDIRGPSATPCVPDLESNTKDSTRSFFDSDREKS